MTWAVESLSGYQPRIVDAELDELLPQLPAIALEGAKGVGKTATAKGRVRSAHYLDDDRQLEVARADVNRLLATDPPVLIDEWQRLPRCGTRSDALLTRTPVPHGSCSPARPRRRHLRRTQGRAASCSCGCDHSLLPNEAWPPAWEWRTF